MPARLTLFIIALVLIALAVIGISARAWFDKTASTKKDKPQQPVSAAVAPVASGIFVAPALPVTISVGAPNGDRGFSEIPLVINAKAESKVTNLSLVLFELSQTGKLLGAESINGSVDLASKRSDNLPLRARRLVQSGSPVVLALESVSGPDGSWQVDFSTLLEAAVAVAGNKPVPSVDVNQRDDRQAVDYGSNHCARAFAVASHLGRFSENGGMPSFYCDQQTRGFFFSYSSPARTQ